MKPMRYVALALLVALGGCAGGAPATVDTSNASNRLPAQPLLWKMLVGKWHGERSSKEGQRIEWLTERKGRGGYQTTFRVIEREGRISEIVEVGEWGASGPIYFTVFKGWMQEGRYVPNDPSDPANRDAYRITLLTGEQFSYEHVANGEKYTVKRVPDAFELAPLPK